VVAVSHRASAARRGGHDEAEGHHRRRAQLEGQRQAGPLVAGGCARVVAAQRDLGQVAESRRLEDPVTEVLVGLELLLEGRLCLFAIAQGKGGDAELAAHAGPPPRAEVA